MKFRVPGSTTNLAHGFDCLGIALGLANTITVLPTTDGLVSAPGAADPGLQPMAAKVRDACVEAWGVPIPGFSVTVEGDVPIARGMGSSATILCGVAAACREMASLPEDPASILAVAAGIEGHPDNVTAAVLGGVTIVGPAADGLHAARIAVPPDLLAVVAIPPFEVKTSDARRILPHEMSRTDAIRGLQRTGLIVAALAQGRIDDLQGLFDDAWHEQYRAPLNRGFAEAREAAAKAGALGTIISGSGSTVLSFVRRGTGDDIRNAVAASYHSLGIAAQVLVLPFDNFGLRRLAD